MKCKIIFCCLALTAVLTCRIPIFPQTKKNSYAADLIIKKGTNAERKDVLILQEDGVLKIKGAKDHGFSKTFPYASIKKADYSYSEKPQVKEALIVALITNNWLIGLSFLFTKTKKHWLVLTTETEPFIFELEKDSYRRLLLEMNQKGINVEDLGDRDSKEEPMPHPTPAVNFMEGESCENL